MKLTVIEYKSYMLITYVPLLKFYSLKLASKCEMMLNIPRHDWVKKNNAWSELGQNTKFLDTLETEGFVLAKSLP